jgi:hypothetical protein
MRKTGAALLLGMAALALTACGSTQPQPAHSAAAAATTASAPAPATAAPASQASSSPMDAWCNGAGASDYQKVQNDITQLSGDLNANSTGNFGADASKLNADAGTAEGNPPPGTRAQKVNYVLYMGAITFAMTFLNQGNIAEAESAMNGAAKYLNGPNGVNNTVAACG